MSSNDGNEEPTLMSTVSEYVQTHLYTIVVVVVMLLILFAWYYGIFGSSERATTKKGKGNKSGSGNSSELKDLVDDIHQTQKENKKKK